MKHIPILFSTHMVRALLQGIKTQTRRLRGLDYINSTNPDGWEFIGKTPEHDVPHPADKGRNDAPWFQFSGIRNNSFTFVDQCPFGKPGDVLWVRETFAYGYLESFLYKATDTLEDDYQKWKPSIHMPKEACRLFLRVKEIKVERLQDISEGDAMAEGINPYTHNGDANGINNVAIFRDLWISIHGQESWDLNPWVWTVEFEQISEEEAGW